MSENDSDRPRTRVSAMFPLGDAAVEPEEAHAYARIRREQGDAVVLMPTVEAILDASRDPEDTLVSLRTLIDSLLTAIRTGLLKDLAVGDDTGSALSGTASALENALIEVYGSHPRALARVLMQFVIDLTLSDVLSGESGER